MAKKKKKVNIKAIVVLVVMILLLVGYYYYLSNKNRGANEDGDVEITKVQEVLMRDLTRRYPQTPKEVIRYYSEITECFYNEELNDTELTQLAMQAQLLYDDELVANKTQEQYITDLQGEILTFRENGYTIQSYTTSSSIDIENSRFTADGYEWVRVYCDYILRRGTETIETTELFLLRKDENGHWRIYGWDLADDYRG